MNIAPSAIDIAKKIVKDDPQVFPYPKIAAAVIASAMLDFYFQIKKSLEPDLELNTIGNDLTKLDDENI